MQFFDGAFRFLDGLHLNECKTLGALIVPVTDYLRVLNVPNSVEQLEQVALSRVEGKISDVETGRRNFDWLGFTLVLEPRLALLLVRLLWRTVSTTHTGWSFRAVAVAEKGDEPLPEGFLGGIDARVLMTRLAIAPSAGTASRTPRTSPG